MNAPLLYITYDGLLEPLGQSQVLAYQEKLAAGRTVHILSFEKPDDWRDTGKRQTVLYLNFRPLSSHAPTPPPNS